MVPEGDSLEVRFDPTMFDLEGEMSQRVAQDGGAAAACKKSRKKVQRLEFISHLQAGCCRRVAGILQETHGLRGYPCPHKVHAFVQHRRA